MPLCWIPYHLWSMYNYEASYEVSFAVFVMGVITWTWFEYILHRFLFHGEDNWMNYIPDSNYVFTLHFIVHGIHHAFPQDALRLLFPPLLGHMIITPCIYMPITNSFPAWFSFPFFSGVMFGY